MGNNKPFAFKASKINLWNGRYSRPWSDTSTYKIRYTREYGFWPLLEWDNGCEKATCLACDCNGIEELIKAVNKVKLETSGREGLL